MTDTIVEGPEPNGAPVGHSPQAKVRRRPNEAQSPAVCACAGRWATMPNCGHRFEPY